MSLSPYNSMNNNPISYTDPDGDFSFLGAAFLFGAVTSFQAQQSGASSFGDYAKFAAINGATALATAGVGNIAAGIGNVWLQAGFQIGAHATIGGTASVAHGGNFWSGAAAGGVSSATSSLAGIAGVGNYGMIGVGSLSGGLGSLAGGGNFWDGARQGFITSAFNHVAHGIEGIIDGPGGNQAPDISKAFPGAEYQGMTKNGRHTWKWKNKWLEWTNKGKGAIEMYDNKTQRKHKGKWDHRKPNTRIKAPIKTRIADALKHGMRYFKAFPVVVPCPGCIENYPSNQKKLH